MKTITNNLHLTTITKGQTLAGTTVLGTCDVWQETLHMYVIESGNVERRDLSYEFFTNLQIE